MAEVHEEVARIADAAEKLLRAVEGLRRDMALLNGRLVPFDNEAKLPAPTALKTQIRNLKDALNVIDEARRSILGCEREATAMRALMDEIANDVQLREDMKPYIKEPPPRPGPRR